MNTRNDEAAKIVETIVQIIGTEIQRQWDEGKPGPGVIYDGGDTILVNGWVEIRPLAKSIFEAINEDKICGSNAGEHDDQTDEQIAAELRDCASALNRASMKATDRGLSVELRETTIRQFSWRESAPIVNPIVRRILDL